MSRHKGINSCYATVWPFITILMFFFLLFFLSKTSILMYVCPPQSHRLTCKSYFFSNGAKRKWQRIEIQEKVIKSGFVPFRICYTTLKQFKTRTQRDERKVLRLMGFTLQDLQYPGSNEVLTGSFLYFPPELWQRFITSPLLSFTASGDWV